MSVPISFDEIIFDPTLIHAAEGEKFPVTGSPEFANTIIFNEKTGAYKTNVPRQDAVRKIQIMVKLATVEDSDYFNNFWLGGEGSGYGFRFRYTPDFKSIDEVFGIGDGTNKDFYLVKTYKRPGANHNNVRRIIKPVTNTNLMAGSVTLLEPNGVDTRVIPSVYAASLNVPAFTIKINGVATSAFTINNTTGKVSFTNAPLNGAVLSFSGEHDTPVAFIGNSYQHQFDTPSEIQGIALREILPYELGIFV